MELMNQSYELLTPITVETLKIIEKAGRVCYKSENNITKDSANKFIRRIIKSGHHSVIEHGYLTFKFITDRGVTHELVRHRLASYSQESTRYINVSEGIKIIIPPWIKDLKPGVYNEEDLEKEKYLNTEPAEYMWLYEMFEIEKAYRQLNKEHGWKPQQARSVLPNALKTEIVMSANYREWRHVFSLRCSEAAHPQIRQLLIPVLNFLKHSAIGVIFEDIHPELTEKET